MSSEEDFLQLALQSHRAGQLVEARQIYEQIAQRQPNNADVQHLLGLVSHQVGQNDVALQFIQQAIALSPNSAVYHLNLGNVLAADSAPDNAIASYRRAIALDPANAVAHNNLGNVLQATGTLVEAEACFRQALALDPAYADAHYNLGNLRRSLDDLDEAAACYRQAIQLRPAFPEALENLGLVLEKREALVEAEQVLASWVRLQPENAKAHMRLAVVQQKLGEIESARASYQQVVRWDPENVEAHCNLATCHLLLGEYQEGWREYRWWERAVEDPRDLYPQPVWEGSSLAGRRLLVHSEQGIGDDILFASCLPEVIEQAKGCDLVCSPRLAGLFARSFPDANIIAHTRTNDRVPPQTTGSVDVQIALGRLPERLRPTSESFSTRPRHLLADAEQVAVWRDRYSQLGRGLKVGISWQAGRGGGDLHSRSTNLIDWAEILAAENAQFVNLQYGPCDEELAAVRQSLGMAVHHFAEADPLGDLDAFAAKVAALDLVISVGNATAHLAGGLGVPVWVLLPQVPVWRWQLRGERSPWYASARLFRLSERGQWAPLLRTVAAKLKQELTQHASANH